MYQAKKKHWRMEEWFHSVLNLTLGASEWPASQPSCATRKKRKVFSHYRVEN